MRVWVKLLSTKDCSYDLKYYHKLQGLIYSLLRDTEYSSLHDKKGYKFFCFSNIFPVPPNYQIKGGEDKQLLISSPDKLFIKILCKKLDGNIIHIGEMEFEVKEVKKLRVRLKRNCRLISATPIIIRIPEKNYERYGIPSEFRKKRYVYWRPQYSFEAFVKQLEENLIKKYKEFFREDFEIERIFEVYRFRKPVVSHVIIGGREQKFVGSLWEFWFSHLSKKQKRILEFGIDCGFGERNSLGFGFINVIR